MKSKKASAEHDVGFECSFVSLKEDTSTERSAGVRNLEQMKSPSVKQPVPDNNTATEHQHRHRQLSSPMEGNEVDKVNVDLVTKKSFKTSMSILKKPFDDSVSEKSNKESKSDISSASVDADSKKLLKTSNIILKKSSTKQPEVKGSAKEEGKVKSKPFLKEDSLSKARRSSVTPLDHWMVTRLPDLYRNHSCSRRRAQVVQNHHQAIHPLSQYKRMRHQPKISLKSIFFYFAPLVKLATSIIRISSKKYKP